jgi:hypothetical protein
MTQEQLDETVESGVQRDVEGRRPDLSRNGERAASANPCFDFVQPSGSTQPDQLAGVGMRQGTWHPRRLSPYLPRVRNAATAAFPNLLPEAWNAVFIARRTLAVCILARSASDSRSRASSFASRALERALTGWTRPDRRAPAETEPVLDFRVAMSRFSSIQATKDNNRDVKTGRLRHSRQRRQVAVGVRQHERLDLGSA